jgi:hypothetical protein
MNPPKLPNETTDEYVVRVWGPFPDTEFDQRNDFGFMKLPTTQKENAEGFGVFNHNQGEL